MEKENREVLLSKLREHLQDGGFLVINNHINRYSFLGFQFWIRKGLAKKDKKIINSATEKEFRKMLDHSGFIVREVYKFTFFPGRKNLIFLPEKLLRKIELTLSRVPLLRNFSLSQIYICQKKN